MTVRYCKVHPATVKVIADYLAKDAKELGDSYREFDGVVRPKEVADEVHRLKVWVAKLRAILKATASAP